MNRQTLSVFAVLTCVCGACRAQDRHYALVGARIIPVAGPEIDRGVLVIQDDKITALGAEGSVSIPDKKAGVLVQSEGDNWRAWRNGPVTISGIWILLGILALLALFFAIRGRIRVERGMSGQLIERFNGIERFAHWLTAVSFIVLLRSWCFFTKGQSALNHSRTTTLPSFV